MPPNDPNQQTTPGQQPVVDELSSQASQIAGTSVDPDQQPPAQPNTPDYDFIVNPEQQPRPKPFENTKMPVKIAVFGGGLIVLLIIFSIVRGLITGPSIGEKFLSVVQDQQQIILIVTEASKQQGLSTINANSAITTQLGLSTDQANTIEYMAKNGKKVNDKDLNLALDGKLTERLEASAAAGTYNETYKAIIAQELEAYMNNMSVLYKQINGKNGRALLDQNYKSAKLLLQQLQAT